MPCTLPGPDLDPVEAAARLHGLPGRVLLDSASDADGVGRWSFAAAEPSSVLVSRGRAEALDELERAVAAAAPDKSGAPLPRAIGWLGYDLGRALEPRAAFAGPGGARADLELPDLCFGLYPAIWRRDRLTGRAEVVGEPAAAARLHAALSRLAPAAPAAPAAAAPPRLGPLAADRPDADYLAAVARVLDYIRAGDVYQVNLSRRLSAPLDAPGDPLALYRRSAELAPAPYGALVELAGVTVISNSPELFLRRPAGDDGARVETRPIKGTRARAADAAADAARAAELRADAKELAEHLMIVDLLRNDLGRVATTGSVRVDDYARLLALPTVHHLVSTVSAAPRPGAGPAALLRACFPGGSITGAPKIRAMQIIDELEPVRRGPYTGAIGYLGAGGALDLAIAIRTLVLAGQRLSLHVGGGIVADSTPERELEETEEKAAAWRRVLAGLDA